MIDSDSEEDFIHEMVISQLRIKTEKTQLFMIVLADGEEISQELIDTKVIVNAKVQEEAQILELNVLRCFKYCVVLRLLWLREKNPQID